MGGARCDRAGDAVSETCACRDVTVDWVRGLIFHPYRSCPYFGQPTLMFPAAWPQPNKADRKMFVDCSHEELEIRARDIKAKMEAS